MTTKIPYFAHVAPKTTPQTEPVPGKAMVANHAGGFGFAVDDWTRLDRFLVLGSEGGTYYVGERELTRENAAVVGRCLDADPVRVVRRVAEISDAGRAPKNDPAVFALALAASHTKPEARKEAYAALPRVCRTGTHLFQFVAACDALRGWGAGLRRAVADWYAAKDPEALGYQLAKYQSRGGWSHRDVLRLCHAAPAPDRAALYRWVQGGPESLGARTVTRGKGEKARTRTYPAVDAAALPPSVRALEELKRAGSAAECVALIGRYGDKAPRELVPTKFLADPAVWAALLPHMPLTATLRNLGAMTRNGLLAPLSDAARTVCGRLRDAGRLKKARVHPLAVLVALKTYQQGHGARSQGEGWTPVQSVVDALNDAFYLAFDAVEPTGRRWFFGLDVSGSMGSPIAGMPVTCAEAAAALALVSVRTESQTYLGAFADAFREVSFGRSTRLDDALRATRGMTFGRTDCALPMLEAARRQMPVDVFCVLTDNETYAGSVHPFQALKMYRERTGIPAKLVVVGMTATGFTIADPSDAGMLDVVGFDTAVPQVMADFARGF